MKRITFPSPLGGPDGFNSWVRECLQQLERESVVGAESIMSEFTITGTVTETRTLDVDTATATDVANFVATLINDIKRGGQKKSYGS